MRADQTGLTTARQVACFLGETMALVKQTLPISRVSHDRAPNSLRLDVNQAEPAHFGGIAARTQ
jgi:hypothetical protein